MGVIVLYIPHSVLFEFGVKGDYIDTLYNSQLNEALSSHINSGIGCFSGFRFAFLTILALAFEPSAQRVLDFRAKRVMIRGQRPPLGIAKQYLSKGFATIDSTDRRFFHMN